MTNRHRDHRTVIVYDITEDARRDKVHRFLKRYAVPIQKSAFEGRLTRAERDAIVRVLGPLIDPATNRLVVYIVGAELEDNTVVLGAPLPEHPSQAFFII